jgi:hypothetical protein
VSTAGGSETRDAIAEAAFVDALVLDSGERRCAWRVANVISDDVPSAFRAPVVKSTTAAITNARVATRATGEFPSTKPSR